MLLSLGASHAHKASSLSMPMRRPAFAHRPAALSSYLTLRGGQASLPAELCSEGLGTFLLLLAVRLSPRFPEKALRPIQLPVLPTLAAIIYCIGPISGAVINPAVSTALLAAGEISLRKYCSLVAVQC